MKSHIFTLILVMTFFVLSSTQTHAQTIPKMLLSWETGSYTPPFYEGKALPGPGSHVRVVAVLPNNNKNSFTFTWSKDGRVLGSQSGKGINTLEFDLPTINSVVNISVKVTGSDSSIFAQKSLNLVPIQPTIAVYPYKESVGIMYNNAVTSSATLGTEKEISFSAVPYYMNLDGKQPSYIWSMNGNQITDQTGSVLTLRNDNGSKGTANISGQAKIDGLNQTNQQGFSLSF